jgi:hypothetical protein
MNPFRKAMRVRVRLLPARGKAFVAVTIWHRLVTGLYAGTGTGGDVKRCGLKPQRFA